MRDRAERIPIKSRRMSGRRVHLFEAGWHSRRKPLDPHKVAREPPAGCLHPAIIDLETWDRVQQKLESQTRERRISQPDDHSFLAGKLYDDRGNRMSSSHASKGGGAGDTMCRVRR